MLRQLTLAVLALAMIVALWTVARADGDEVAADAATLRVGVFSSRVVAVAYARSEQFRNYVSDKAAQGRQAQEAGDTERYEEIDIEMQALQEHVHDQVFGGGPIDDILAEIEDDLADVASEAGVDLIVEKCLFCADRVQKVDVTNELANLFEPDEQTMEIMADLLNRFPAEVE